MKKESFILYTFQAETISELSLEQKGALLTAIFEYAAGEQPEIPDQAVRVAFKSIRVQIEHDSKKYTDVCEKRRKAANNRWQSDVKSSKAMQMHANACKCIQSDANNANAHFAYANDYDNVVDIDVDIDKHNNEFNKEKDSKKERFIDEIYNLYPSKCPVRNISTGKCKKDRDRIEKLLHTYSPEEIKQVVKKEIEDKLNKHPLKNFSTFLNNFPDPTEMKQELQYPKSIEDVRYEDIKQCSAFPLFMDWIDEAGRNILEVNRKGFPTDIKQFNRMVSVTKGGARTLAYVTLVLNRDGLGEYGDESGFMWTYLNYIKKHDLYKG